MAGFLFPRVWLETRGASFLFPDPLALETAPHADALAVTGCGDVRWVGGEMMFATMLPTPGTSQLEETAKFEY